jgi:BirA family biotin operon repressor/biotin-[acetyl-CoA-carboxylase] ligase
MDLKEQVLKELENHKGEYVSGGKLAETLHFSRNAVWKAVKSLVADGHDIQAVTNKGYRLSPDSDVLTAAAVEKHLGALAGVFDIDYRATVTSTNSVLKDLAAGGAREGTVVAAITQTAGRGRFGRSFYSPADSGVYFSVLLRPGVGAPDATLLTTAAAVAVARAVEDVTGAPARIKWVNDVYCGGKKVCGILTEVPSTWKAARWTTPSSVSASTSRLRPAAFRRT